MSFDQKSKKVYINGRGFVSPDHNRRSSLNMLEALKKKIIRQVNIRGKMFRQQLGLETEENIKRYCL